MKEKNSKGEKDNKINNNVKNSNDNKLKKCSFEKSTVGKQNEVTLQKYIIYIYTGCRETQR